MVHLCFGLLMKMDVNPNLAGKADLYKVETSGASRETADQDKLKCFGKYIFRGGKKIPNTLYAYIMFQ